MPRREKVRIVQVVVVSSPGAGAVPHWSHEVAGDFARQAVARGAAVRWLVALHGGQPTPPGGPGLQVFAHKDRKVLAVNKVAGSQLDVPLEVTLSECLRAEPLSVVVHIGVGGQGTPNVLWLADRLGSRTFACARGAELVCHRGDLLDRDKKICKNWMDPERCRWCCSIKLFGNPSSNDLRNRADLFIAGFHACVSISVPTEEDVSLVADLGVAQNQIAIGASAEDLISRVFAEAD